MTKGLTHIRSWLLEHVSIAPLTTLRILFGVLMFLSVLRFWWKGWIESNYLEPLFQFKYFGFEWVSHPGEVGVYALFALAGLSAIGIALGAFYRLSALLFFLSFTYIELLDATYYLNHYYFVSCMALLMVFLPLNRHRSIDVLLGWSKPAERTTRFNVALPVLLISLVYCYAGMAKLNADWLLEAMPLKIWLPANDHLPLIGSWLAWEPMAYVFSWVGAVYDLFIPFLLIWNRTRIAAYAAVVGFHVLTWLMFPIGMFPFIMIALTTVFFSAHWHQRAQELVLGRANASAAALSPRVRFGAGHYLAMVFVVAQLAIPFRHVMYDGNLFWHEQGYRFGWRVMLVEKAGYAQFQVLDKSGRSMEVDNREFLTVAQEKMMSTQPDFMLQYAHWLQDHYRSKGVEVEQVKADVFVTFNGRNSRRFIDPNINLAGIVDGWENKDWILPLKA